MTSVDDECNQSQTSRAVTDVIKPLFTWREGNPLVLSFPVFTLGEGSPYLSGWVTLLGGLTFYHGKGRGRVTIELLSHLRHL